MPVHPKTKKNRPKKRSLKSRKNNRKIAIRGFLNRLFSNRKVINNKLNKSIQMGGFDPIGMVLGPVQKVSGKIANEMAKTITPEVIQDASGCISFMKTVGEKMPPPGGATILGISKILTMMIESIQFTMGVAKTASGITKDSVLLIIEPIYNKMQDKIGIDPASFRQLKLKIQSMDPNISKEMLFKELQSLPQWNGLIESIKQNVESLPIPEMFKNDIRNIIGQFISSGTQSGQTGISSSKKAIKPEFPSSYDDKQIERAKDIINQLGINPEKISRKTLVTILESLLTPYEPESLDLTIKNSKPSTNTKKNVKANGALPGNPPREPVNNSGQIVQNTTISPNQIDLNIPDVQTLNVQTLKVPTVNQAKSMATSAILNTDIGANSMEKLKQMESMSKENVKKAALGALTQTPIGSKAMNTIKNVKSSKNIVESMSKEQLLSIGKSKLLQSPIGANAMKQIKSAQAMGQSAKTWQMN